MEQHRLGLVVGVVADDNGRCANLAGHAGQEAVAGGAAGRLLRNAGRAGFVGQRQALAPVAQTTRAGLTRYGRGVVSRT